MATYPDAWKEVCKIGVITSASASAIEFAGFTEDITAMDWGEKDIEGVAMLNGGRVVKFTPMTDESITMKVYDVRADSATANSVIQLFNPQGTADSTQPILVNNTITRNPYGLILLWADTLPATSQTVPSASACAYRIQIVNAYMTKCAPSFDDKVKSAEVTFKWAPFQKDGTANKREESTDGTSQLPAALTSNTTL